MIGQLSVIFWNTQDYGNTVQQLQEKAVKCLHSSTSLLSLWWWTPCIYFWESWDTLGRWGFWHSSGTTVTMGRRTYKISHPTLTHLLFGETVLGGLFCVFSFSLSLLWNQNPHAPRTCHKTKEKVKQSVWQRSQAKKKTKSVFIRKRQRCARQRCARIFILNKCVWIEYRRDGSSKLFVGSSARILRAETRWNKSARRVSNNPK